MPRKYKKVGGRHYTNFTLEHFQNAIAKVRSGKLSHRKASELFNISSSTLARYLSTPIEQWFSTPNFTTPEWRPDLTDQVSINQEILNWFFDTLSMTIEDVSPSNIWNYDKANLQDDPEKKKVLVKRGAEQPEIIRNSTKAAVLIMICGNAEGLLALPYVGYKAVFFFQAASL
ncbi:uncharacterized protein [Halyomorpha halys]|uniref:uncharacterized protein n=1 Tax=Halyomorpha halys TaxID=286706 RepID=UPI0034D2014D